MPEIRFAEAEGLILSLLAGDRSRPREDMTDEEFAVWVAKRFAVTKGALIFALQNVPGLAIISLADVLAKAFYAQPKTQEGAKLVLNVPGEVVEDLTTNEPADRDLYLLVHIPNETLRRQRSPIVLPGENRGAN